MRCHILCTSDDGFGLTIHSSTLAEMNLRKARFVEATHSGDEVWQHFEAESKVHFLPLFD
jgi:hypothetical protein